VIARAAVAVLAGLMIAWLVIVERDTRLQSQATRLSHHGATPAELARAESDLRAARLLNPDGTLDIARSVVQRTAGQDATSRATLGSLLRREPDNLTAWGLLFVYSQRDDPAAARRALAARERLDPLNARKAR
jgi:tRNA C32,U32 (ribose-2'-O)-methylase TrmJ